VVDLRSEDEADGQRLIDVRTPAEFNGQASRAHRAGHIPTAVNFPRGEMLDPDGNLLPGPQLRARFESLGVTDETVGQTVFYCNAGVSASFGLLALRSAGWDAGAVYDGSWKDWGNDDQKPIIQTGKSDVP
jgi:thiosulfate/3-mercaptopyruvate sulfurtransferase